ncbi:MAG: class I SAM-dependent methyltransferase [Erysipelotrichaceae bacterium]|nr:class I SAM-dependent methyltransferase [Erysipelotrichaceae bacterium]
MKLVVNDPSRKDEADLLAKELDLSLADSSDDIHFVLAEDGLSLVEGNLKEKGDFSKMIKRLKPNNLNGEMLIKAIRIKGRKDLLVYDMTAGMGEDSFLLAAYGYRVEMFESNPYIAALLRDAIIRGRADDSLFPIVNRMNLHVGDSTLLAKELKMRADVIYLDVMFPQRDKKALVKKKFQLLHKLALPCANEEEMLEAAKNLKPSKIVVKRPLKSLPLANMKPSYSIEGKAIRYDCLLLNDGNQSL